MQEQEIKKEIERIEKQIEELPAGSVTRKKINGREYFYQRYSAQGKRHEKYISADEVETLTAKIKLRKELEQELKALQGRLPKVKPVKGGKRKHVFNSFVRTGEQLVRFAKDAAGYKHRECYAELEQYLFGEERDKVFVLFGLRRTGKTTMIKQALLAMSEADLERAVFIQITSQDTLRSVNADLSYLEDKGYKYIFLDEVTLMEDFIEGAALFSDIYASSGMKIVLSGTDSLGFVFTNSEQLYDRSIMLHTTFIAYREFANVLGIKGIDKFIHYGGTMSMGGVHYNESSSFASKKCTDEYIDSAIAHNIQHSLAYYQDGGHFRLLYDLYVHGELTSAINRVVEDLNHRFTKEVLTRKFKSSTLATAARNLLHDRAKHFDLLGNIDADFVLESVKAMLDILEKEEQTVAVSDAHAYQIKEYLFLLDMLEQVEQKHFPELDKVEPKILISQPGIRYAQTEALVNSLLMDKKFNTISAIERKTIIERVMGTIEGRMMEDVVLLETKMARPKQKVFQLQFPVGEFDMVVQDLDKLTCAIYEIKYSQEQVPQQYQHLVNEEKCAQTEHSFGKIIGKYVIYRGPSRAANAEGIQYLNVEEYLQGLG